MILGVGGGWQREEYDAIQLPYEKRGEITEECIEIYKRAWMDDVVEFHGRYYDFANLSMDPKPLQKPASADLLRQRCARRGAARRRHCDGLYTMFVDAVTVAEPDRYSDLQEQTRGS